MASIDTATLWERARWRALAQLIVCVAAGVLAGVTWAALSPRALYRINDDLRATLSERDHAEIVGGDATFTIIVALFGLGIGLLTWLWFQQRGWLLVGLSVVGSTVVALVAWQVGEMIGGAGLTEALAASRPGDLVRMDLELHALSALAAAPFAAVTPVMLLAAFLPERSVDADEGSDPAR